MTPKVGKNFKMLKMHDLCCLISQLLLILRETASEWWIAAEISKKLFKFQTFSKMQIFIIHNHACFLLFKKKLQTFGRNLVQTPIWLIFITFQCQNDLIVKDILMKSSLVYENITSWPSPPCDLLWSFWWPPSP